MKTLDQLTYTYKGNRLTRVDDSAPGVTNVDYQQFYDGVSEATEYLYDQNGNMTVDKNSGITRVSYDANNQPDSVTFSTGESIRYYYDGMGNRLGTDEYTAFMPVYLQGAANTLTDDDDREVLRRRYCGNFIYEDGILQRVLVEGGFITFSNGAPQYHFYLKDHLGSNRVVTDANGNIEEYNHYYPYGALMNISSASTQPYKYNGKELNRLNRLLWYDQSARQYNPILGRFMSMDPLCEKYYSISPYAYCAGNPVKYVDPTGEYIAVRDGNSTYKWDMDKQVFADSKGNAYDGNNAFIQDVTKWINTLCAGDTGREIVSELFKAETGNLIVLGSECSNDYLTRTKLAKYREDGTVGKDENISNVITMAYDAPVEAGTHYSDLGHEMAHAYDQLKNTFDSTKWYTSGNGTVVPKAEIYATFMENKIRAEHSLPIRRYYSHDKGTGAPEYISEITTQKGYSIYFDCNGNHGLNWEKANSKFRYKF